MPDYPNSQRTAPVVDLPYQDSGRVGAGTIGGPAFANLAPRPAPVTVGSPGVAYKGVLEYLLPNFDARAEDIRAKNREGLVAEPAATPTPSATPPATAVAPKPVAGAEKAPARTPDFTTKDTSAPAIKRIDQKGQAPLFTNLEPAAAVAEMKGNPLGIVPAGVNPFGGGGSGAVSAALQAAAERGDWAAIQNHYQKGGGTWLGEKAGDGARSTLLASLATPAEGRSRLSKNQASLLSSFLTGEATAQATRAQTGAQAALTQAQADQLTTQQGLFQAYADAKDPAAQAEIARKILVMQGKDPRGDVELQKSRTALLGELFKAYSASPSPPEGADGKPMPIDEYVRKGLELAGAGPGRSAGSAPAGADAIRAQYQAGTISREQATAALKKLGMQ